MKNKTFSVPQAREIVYKKEKNSMLQKEVIRRAT